MRSSGGLGLLSRVYYGPRGNAGELRWNAGEVVSTVAKDTQFPLALRLGNGRQGQFIRHALVTAGLLLTELDGHGDTFAPIIA